MLGAFKEWRARYKDRMDAFYFWAAGGGGGGIVNVDDAAELQRMMLEFPFSLHSQIEATPIVDGDVALEQFQQFMQQLMASMGGG